jgi:hypothetical protein
MHPLLLLPLLLLPLLLLPLLPLLPCLAAKENHTSGVVSLPVGTLKARTANTFQLLSVLLLLLLKPLFSKKLLFSKKPLFSSKKPLFSSKKPQSNKKSKNKSWLTRTRLPPPTKSSLPSKMMSTTGRFSSRTLNPARPKHSTTSRATYSATTQESST